MRNSPRSQSSLVSKTTFLARTRISSSNRWRPASTGENTAATFPSFDRTTVRPVCSSRATLETSFHVVRCSWSNTLPCRIPSLSITTGRGMARMIATKTDNGISTTNTLPPGLREATKTRTQKAESRTRTSRIRSRMPLTIGNSTVDPIMRGPCVLVDRLIVRKTIGSPMIASSSSAPISFEITFIKAAEPSKALGPAMIPKCHPALAPRLPLW